LRKRFIARPTNFVLGIKVEPRDVAEIVIDRVVDYCENNSGDIFVCQLIHSPDQLDVFIDNYLTEEELRELVKEIDKSEKFWDEVEEAYEELWRMWITIKVAGFLSEEVYLPIYSIIDNLNLGNDCKAKRLEAYEEVLDNLGDEVQRALQRKKPLSKNDLAFWFTKLGNIAFRLKNNDYFNQVNYYLSYYDVLNNDEKLKVLEYLLKYIHNVVYHAISDELGKLYYKNVG